ncbi:MAG: hypothetical protein ACJ74H_13250 [Thermoanaerobaculia bacterium]
MRNHRFAPLLLSLAVSVLALAQRPNPQGAHVVIPVVAHAGGIHSEFRSDVFLFNRGETFADLSLTFTPSGADGTSQFVTAQQILAPGQLVELQDVVATLFHTTGSGALEIGGDIGSILTRSTTYNPTPHGRLAQSVVPVSSEDAIGLGEKPLVVMPVASTEVSRTNLGITETAGKAGVVRVTRGFGFLAGHTIEIPILPYSHVQFPAAMDVSANTFSASVDVIGGEARVVAYASMIEHHSGDPMYIAGKRSTTSPLVIPVAAHFNGPVVWALETWYAYVQPETDIIFPLALPANPPPPLLTFYPSHQPDAARTHQAPDYAYLIWTNSAVGAFFEFFDGAAGHIQYTPPDGAFIMTRLWTPTDDGDGTVGQVIDPVPLSHAIGDGESADAIGVAVNGERRTNVGITEVTGAPARVQVALLDAAGMVIGTKDVDVAGHGNVQFSIATIAPGAIDLATARFTVIGGTGRILGYASVIERVSKDPTFILAE